MSKRAHIGASEVHSKDSTRVAESHATESYQKPIYIETFKSFEFYRDPKLLISAKVCKINGKLFVGVDKFWFEPNSKSWLPTRKGHMYMTPEQWRAFAQYVPALTQALNGVEKKTKMHVASSGMRTYSHLL